MELRCNVLGFWPIAIPPALGLHCQAHVHHQPVSTVSRTLYSITHRFPAKALPDGCDPASEKCTNCAGLQPRALARQHQRGPVKGHQHRMATALDSQPRGTSVVAFASFVICVLPVLAVRDRNAAAISSGYQPRCPRCSSAVCPDAAQALNCWYGYEVNLNNGSTSCILLHGVPWRTGAACAPAAHEQHSPQAPGVGHRLETSG